MRHWLVVAAGLGVAWVASTTSPVGALDVARLVAPYIEARDRGHVGEVSGSAHAGSLTPAGLPVPYRSVGVKLFPSSPEFEEELNRVKVALKDSLRSYVGAADRVTAARGVYEGALESAGAGALIHAAVSSPAGQFRFREIPAGEWLLLAWRGVEHATPGRKIPPREADRFVGNVERTGHAVINYWRIRLEVSAGQITEVALTDRNIWLTVVLEGLRSPDAAGDSGRRSRGTAR